MKKSKIIVLAGVLSFVIISAVAIMWAIDKDSKENPPVSTDDTSVSQDSQDSQNSQGLQGSQNPDSSSATAENTGTNTDNIATDTNGVTIVATAVSGTAQTNESGVIVTTDVPTTEKPEPSHIIPVDSIDLTMIVTGNELMFVTTADMPFQTMGVADIKIHGDSITDVKFTSFSNSRKIAILPVFNEKNGIWILAAALSYKTDIPAGEEVFKFDVTGSGILNIEIAPIDVKDGNVLIGVKEGLDMQIEIF
jgi:hypothetical protein